MRNTARKHEHECGLRGEETESIRFSSAAQSHGRFFNGRFEHNCIFIFLWIDVTTYNVDDLVVNPN